MRGLRGPDGLRAGRGAGGAWGGARREGRAGPGPAPALERNSAVSVEEPPRERRPRALVLPELGKLEPVAEAAAVAGGARRSASGRLAAIRWGRGVGGSARG